MGRNRVYHAPSDDVKMPVANATVYAPAPRSVRFGAAFVGPIGTTREVQWPKQARTWYL